MSLTYKEKRLPGNPPGRCGLFFIHDIRLFFLMPVLLLSGCLAGYGKQIYYSGQINYSPDQVFDKVIEYCDKNNFDILSADKKNRKLKAKYFFPDTSTWENSSAYMWPLVKPRRSMIGSFGRYPFVLIDFSVKSAGRGKAGISLKTRFKAFGEPHGTEGIGPFVFRSKGVWEKHILRNIVAYAEGKAAKNK